MSSIPKAPIRRMFKDKTESETRISISAIIAATEGIQNIIYNIVEVSEKLAKHAGRKTILDEDVNLAFKYVIKQ